ncbi:MAG TPA: NAD-dependent epimerase [Burkholderiaceae bacterium]|nr:NAD-dependent epimerase [Burkholderiaceae bacterium]
MKNPVLVTGAAGFIGYYVAAGLLARGDAVVGIDNLNDYYDPQLKKDRLALLTADRNFAFEQLDIADRDGLRRLFDRHRFRRVVHLAAQAGVRYSITHPFAYVDSNVTGFVNVLEQARAFPPQHLVYASSSSVYGANEKTPFEVGDRVDHPVSLYAATKRANELIAHVYARQFGLPLTGLRFFTVYGPWGRPDMAPMKFTRAILEGRPIDVYNHGNMQRDFTYIDDIVAGVLCVLDRVPAPLDGVPERLYNIGNHRPEPLMRFIDVLAKAIGRTPQMNFLPMQQGDVPATYADITDLQRDYGWSPTTSIDEGLPRLVSWYRQHYGV